MLWIFIERWSHPCLVIRSNRNMLPWLKRYSYLFNKGDSDVATYTRTSVKSRATVVTFKNCNEYCRALLIDQIIAVWLWWALGIRCPHWSGVPIFLTTATVVLPHTRTFVKLWAKASTFKNWSEYCRAWRSSTVITTSLPMLLSVLNTFSKWAILPRGLDYPACETYDNSL